LGSGDELDAGRLGAGYDASPGWHQITRQDLNVKERDGSIPAMTLTVKNRCIDCGTCWQWDPQHFASAPRGDAAHLWRQPEGEGETTRALLALQACPEAAIQAHANLVRRTPADGFPTLLKSIRPEQCIKAVVPRTSDCKVSDACSLSSHGSGSCRASLFIQSGLHIREAGHLVAVVRGNQCAVAEYVRVKPDPSRD
jgi:ferredoxin